MNAIINTSIDDVLEEKVRNILAVSEQLMRKRR
jgi:hypothetical protein